MNTHTYAHLDAWMLRDSPRFSEILPWSSWDSNRIKCWLVIYSVWMTGSLTTPADPTPIQHNRRKDRRSMIVGDCPLIWTGVSPTLSLSLSLSLSKAIVNQCWIERQIIETFLRAGNVEESVTMESNVLLLTLLDSIMLCGQEFLLTWTIWPRNRGGKSSRR